jgi:hypothetical protein
MLRHDTARLFIDDAGVYSGDIHLKLTGYGLDAGLTISGTHYSRVIFLGTRGGSIAGSLAANAGAWDRCEDSWRQSHRCWARSVVHPWGNHDYDGAAYVFADSLVLIDGGRLNSTSAVIGSADVHEQWRVSQR